MPTHTDFVSATPVMASLDIERSADFYATLGFRRIYAEPGVYGIVSSGNVEIHFWACSDRKIAEATSCRIQVKGIESLYEHCVSQGVVHPKAPLSSKPWGTSEFGVLDPDGNLLTFYQEQGTHES